MVWGVKASYYDGLVGTDETIREVHQLMKEKGFLHPGDITVNMASMPLHKQGRTNMIKLEKID
jgi:pyruvate kinase